MRCQRASEGALGRAPGPPRLCFIRSPAMTMRTHRCLTNARIDGARARVSDVWLSDDHGTRGNGRLLVRVGVSGSRRLYFRYSRDGHVDIVPLGLYSRDERLGYLTLQQARQKACECSYRLMQDRRVDLRQVLGVAHPRPLESPPACAVSPASATLMALGTAYVDYLKANKGHKGALDVAGNFRNHVAGTPWANVAANAITSTDFAKLLRDIVKKVSPHRAKRVRADLSAAYGLALRAPNNPNAPDDYVRFAITTNPLASTAQLVVPHNPRNDRALDAEELGHLCLALNAMPDAHELPFALVRLSIALGGQRCEQMLRALASQVDRGNGTLLLYDGKGSRPEARPHLLPLVSTGRREVLPLVQRCRETGREFLFGRKPGQHIDGSEVSKAVTEISESLRLKGLVNAPFSYRDLRRSLNTHMAALGIPPEVRNFIQSHDLGGVEKKHYDRHSWMPEKRCALQKLERFVRQCVAKAQESGAWQDSSTASGQSKVVALQQAPEAHV